MFFCDVPHAITVLGMLLSLGWEAIYNIFMPNTRCAALAIVPRYLH